MFVVATDEGRRVKSACGHELCDASENWKTECRVRVRENQSEMNDLYNDWQSPDTDWEFQLREFMCPECFTMLDVEAVPAGYPVVHRFEPDIDVFYEEWLGREAPDSV
ncbi:MAG: acetone carboxylase subunit gamma [Salinigranum sp.]